MSSSQRLLLPRPTTPRISGFARSLRLDLTACNLNLIQRVSPLFHPLRKSFLQRLHVESKICGHTRYICFSQLYHQILVRDVAVRSSIGAVRNPDALLVGVRLRVRDDNPFEFGDRRGGLFVPSQPA